MIDKIVIAGGGTGGHLFPGIAVVEEVRRRHTGVEVMFVGTERGIESRVIPQRGERLELMHVEPLKGGSAWSRIKSVARIPSAMARSASLIREFRPDVVVGVGGYAAGPMVMTAATLGVPTAVLEQNAHVGLTNRLLAPIVQRAYLSFDETTMVFGETKSRVTGNPVRAEFVQMGRRAAADPEGFESRADTIFVLGGSQGARALNQVLPDTLSQIDVNKRGLRVLHQTGASMRDEVQAAYRAHGIEAEVVAFIDDMAAAYARSALVVARSGASTVAELCTVGRPSVLVPFPSAADDHQTKNARALERVGGAVCCLESTLPSGALASELQRLIESPSLRSRMATSARSAGRPDAAEAIVDDLFEWLGGPPATAARPSYRPASLSSVHNATASAPNWARSPRNVVHTSEAGSVWDRTSFASSRRRPLTVDGARWG